MNKNCQQSPEMPGLAVNANHISSCNNLNVLPVAQLPADKQRSIAEELDRSSGEVMKKLEDIRNKIL